MSEAKLELFNVAKKIGDEQIISDVSFRVAAGETVAIYGHSGGGKTVLLNLISGALTLDDGDILIDGKSVAIAQPEARNVGMAFQNFALYPHMTAFENIASPLHSRNEKDVKQKVEEIATLLKIDRFLSHVPAALSNGQKQRTSLARALVAAPSVLLLDDPLRNVDAKLRYEMRLEMPELFRRFNSGVIYVSQDCREVMALADRIAILRDGNIAQIGKPEEVYEQPLDAEIARLLSDSSINLFDCKAKVETGKLNVDPAQINLAVNAPAEVQNGQDCQVGIRPEHVNVTLADDKPPNSIVAHVEAVTPTNLRSLVVMRTQQNREIIAACDENLANNFKSGTEVNISFDPATLLLFAGETNKFIPLSN